MVWVASKRAASSSSILPTAGTSDKELGETKADPEEDGEDEAAQPSCPNESRMVAFRNRSSRRVNLFWVDHQTGAVHPQYEMEAGAGRVICTYLGYQFMFAESIDPHQVDASQPITITQEYVDPDSPKMVIFRGPLPKPVRGSGSPSINVPSASTPGNGKRSSSYSSENFGGRPQQRRSDTAPQVTDRKKISNADLKSDFMYRKKSRQWAVRQAGLYNRKKKLGQL